jgi:hypothetical protein
MNIKIEVACANPPKNLRETAGKVLNCVPAEHLRGFDKIMFVDVVNEPRISPIQRVSLPALYHPRMSGQSAAWGEVAMSVVAPKKKFPQNLITRLALKSNLAQVILSLMAQHYYLTLAKAVKKNQLEPACRAYVEKHFERWRETEGGLRVKLLKPFKPYLDKIAKRLARKYKEELQKSGANSRQR